VNVDGSSFPATGFKAPRQSTPAQYSVVHRDPTRSETIADYPVSHPRAQHELAETFVGLGDVAMEAVGLGNVERPAAKISRHLPAEVEARGRALKVKQARVARSNGQPHETLKCSDPI
jgi:hypothetical protein